MNKYLFVKKPCSEQNPSKSGMALVECDCKPYGDRFGRKSLLIVSATPPALQRAAAAVRPLLAKEAFTVVRKLLQS